MSVRSFSAGGCKGSCEGTARVLTGHDSGYMAAYTILSTALSVYGTIKAIALQERMVKVAERAAARADEYLAIAKHHYFQLAVPTWQRMAKLYDRYTAFWGRENQFIDESFRIREYCPDYTLQEGRAISRVQVHVDRAALAASRAVGKLNTGRACHNATQFAIMSALARVDASNQAFRYEDMKKLDLDKFYYERWKAGAMYVAHMGDRGATSILSGVAQATNGLNALGTATRTMMEASRDVGSALGSLSNTYANLGNTMAKTAGYFGAGGGSTSPFQGGSLLWGESQDGYSNQQTD